MLHPEVWGPAFSPWRLDLDTPKNLPGTANLRCHDSGWTADVEFLTWNIFQMGH